MNSIKPELGRRLTLPERFTDRFPHTVVVILIGCLALLMAAACGGESPGAVSPAVPSAMPTATQDLGAMVQAAVAQALPTDTPTPPPDINATVAAGIAATQAAVAQALPTDTPTPTPDIISTVAASIAATRSAVLTPKPTLLPTPNLNATIEARMAATIAARPTPTPTPTPRPTATLRPTPTRWPTVTPIPTKSPAAVLSEMVKQARPAVVRIETPTSTGSGAIFETRGTTGYVITNQHVVEGVAEVTVTVNDSDTYRGTVLGTDSVRDLAVVKICCGRFRKLTFGDASRLDPGDEVVAMGYALGLSGQATITRGIVSAIRYDSSHRSDVIQTDAAINPGNSGGPMLSMGGEILGINTFRTEESASGRPVDGVGFAISGATVQQQIPTLKTARPAPTTAPTRRPAPTSTPRPGASGGSGFGPTDGELWHDPADGWIETEYAKVSLSDFTVSATFVNPYSAATNSWSYGFIIRDSDTGSSGRFIQVVVTSRGRWKAAWREGRFSENVTIAEGTLGRFNTGAGDRNMLWVTAFGERGLLFVNGEFISSLDLSEVTAAGDVALITGAFTGDEVSGAVTRFEDFQVSSWRKSYGPANGRLQKEPGSVATHNSGVWTRDLVAEAEFVNPRGSDWDYGFIIRRPESGRLEVIGVSGNNSWFHKTRDVGDDRYTDMDKGRLSPRLRSENHLALFAFEEVGLFFVNGLLLARLDLSDNLDYGGVTVMGDFFRDHGGSPTFSNFNVWTP